MSSIKISLITITYNAAETIERCIKSVINQTYKNVEYIIIDGNSIDSTGQIIDMNKQFIHLFRSEADEGIYDAMNKGIRLSTGDIIGMLNSDDYFANQNVLSKIAKAFTHTDTDLLYADLDYVNKKGAVIRKWRSGRYYDSKFNWGWMPPHPTFYAKRDLFDKWGLYNPIYGTAADYELMLRFMYLKTAKIFYLKEVTVKMALGGISNRNYKNRIKAWSGDFRAMKSNDIPIPILGVFIKPLRKVFQFI